MSFATLPPEWNVKLAKELRSVYKYAVAIGVGVMSKQKAPRKLKWFEWLFGVTLKPEFYKHLQVLVVDRLIPQSEWIALSGTGDPQAAQQSIARSIAITHIHTFCAKHGLGYEYHFSPVAFVESPAMKRKSR